MPLIYIILINYNGYKDTIECVNSLKKINYNNYRVLIVDNASMNDSLEILKRTLKDCIIIESKKNLGFAGGNNLAIKYALDNNADYILLLNNDTLVEHNFLENMLCSFSKDSSIGLVGCKIMYYPERNIIWYGGGYVDWFKFTGIHYEMGKADVKCDAEKEINFMTGCSMLIKRDVFEKVGLLSEEYFMYYEDVDFCVRVNDAGYKIWYNPNAVIYHKIGLSAGGEESPFSIKWCTRNRILFMNKYKNKVSKAEFIFSRLFFYVTRIIRYFQYKFQGRSDKAKAIIDGIKEVRSTIL
ncbi:glycosyltransferase family 2 protein [Clostridium fermenticellae]|uniref:Glycosyltransferase family 2 protein n=1 Tax=Clostridium fermenticellae TaxID=2068654 RepID=A0A386H0Z2_9CLOT|nr:glycosyltransferase family 2 protein [Clostridium fermenticellae]AYD39334.1 glycosyltransferase family 2 protein [Clostridium fermenticellae]